MWTISAIIMGIVLQVIFLMWVQKKKEEYKYPIWAGVVGLAVYGVYLYFLIEKFGTQLNIGILAGVAAVFIVAALVDFFNYLLPNRLTLGAFLLALTFVALNLAHWKLLLISGAIFLGVFAVLYIVSMGNFGMGDVKLSVSMGILLGMFGKMVILNFMMWTFASGAIVSILLLLLRIRKKEDKIAFGPYMVFAFLMLLLFM